ncbi:MAG: hypothetical protein P8172_14765 [Gammaproteobacteria bacterium]
MANDHSNKLETESLEALMNRPVEGHEPPPSGGRSIDQIDPESMAPEEGDTQLVSTQMLRHILGPDVTSAEDGPDYPVSQGPFRPVSDGDGSAS